MEYIYISFDFIFSLVLFIFIKHFDMLIVSLYLPSKNPIINYIEQFEICKEAKDMTFPKTLCHPLDEILLASQNFIDILIVLSIL